MSRGGLAPWIPRNRLVLKVGSKADPRHVMWFDYSGRWFCRKDSDCKRREKTNRFST